MPGLKLVPMAMLGALAGAFIGSGALYYTVETSGSALAGGAGMMGLVYWIVYHRDSG